MQVSRRRAPVARARGGLLVPLSRSSREAIRTNLWALPSFMVLLIVGLLVVTYALDVEAAAGYLALPHWLSSGGPDVARQVLIAIAAAVITVAGVVFSITILVLQLASQQFGPRMLRNFIRDIGTQASLVAFVATFVYSVLVLQAVTDPPQSFVPHLSTSVAVALVLIDLGVLSYFIDHVASSIQLTSVVSGIAQDFRTTLAQLQAEEWQLVHADAEAEDFDGLVRTANQGGSIAAEESGFLQAVGYQRLVAIATQSDAVIQLLHQPGHFVVAGQPLCPGRPARRGRTSLTGALAHPPGGSESHAHAGPGLCDRSARRSGAARAFAGGQRYLHGVELHRLAGRLSVSCIRPATAERHLLRRARQGAGDRAGDQP